MDWETIDLYAYCGIGGQYYYPAHFKEFLQSDKCKNLFQETFESKQGYLYKIFEDDGVYFWDRENFYKKAADVGDSAAAFRLGEIYLKCWFREYYEHLLYKESSPNENYLEKAKKYLYYACQKGEPYVIPLIFNVLQILGRET